MTRDTAALAVLLRRTQWLLDDVAYEVAAGRSDAVDLRQVAEVLKSVVSLLLPEAESEASVDSSFGGPGADFETDVAEVGHTLSERELPRAETAITGPAIPVPVEVDVLKSGVGSEVDHAGETDV